MEDLVALPGSQIQTLSRAYCGIGPVDIFMYVI